MMIDSSMPVAVTASSIGLYSLTFLACVWLWYKSSVASKMESFGSSKSMFLYTVAIGVAVRTWTTSLPFPHDFFYTILNRVSLLVFVAAFSFIVYNWTMVISLDVPSERTAAKRLRVVLISVNVVVWGGSVVVLGLYADINGIECNKSDFTSALYDSTILFIAGAQLMLAAFFVYYGRKLVNIVWVATNQLPVRKNAATPYVKYLSFVTTCVVCFLLRCVFFSIHFVTKIYVDNTLFFYCAILVPDLLPIWQQLWFFRNRILMHQEGEMRNKVLSQREMSFDADDWDDWNQKEGGGRSDRDSSLLETHGGSSLTHSLLSPRTFDAFIIGGNSPVAQVV
jgi:hypothetical protein